MSRCKSCDALLTDFEATRKSLSTNEYLDLCNGCFAPISDEIPTIDREDLLTELDDIEHYNFTEWGED